MGKEIKFPRKALIARMAETKVNTFIGVCRLNGTTATAEVERMVDQYLFRNQKSAGRKTKSAPRLPETRSV